MNDREKLTEVDSNNAKFSIVIPAHNEEEALPSLLDSILLIAREKDWNYELLIVDDNSSDKTAEVGESYAGKHCEVRVIHRNKGDNGMGTSLREGTIAANGEFVIWLMADRADDLDTIPKILDKLGEGCDMVFASRYMEGGSRGDLGAFKAFLSSRFTVIARIVFGLPVHDITNAFRGFRREIFDAIMPDSNDFAISPEFAIKAHLRRLRLAEVPTTYSHRKCGMTSFRMVPMMIEYLKLLRYRFLR